jgi:hypothetical protein
VDRRHDSAAFGNHPGSSTSRASGCSRRRGSDGSATPGHVPHSGRGSRRRLRCDHDPADGSAHDHDRTLNGCRGRRGLRRQPDDPCRKSEPDPGGEPGEGTESPLRRPGVRASGGWRLPGASRGAIHVGFASLVNRRFLRHNGAPSRVGDPPRSRQGWKEPRSGELVRSEGRCELVCRGGRGPRAALRASRVPQVPRSS